MKYFVEWYEDISSLYRKEIEANSEEEATIIATNICIEPIKVDIVDFGINQVREIK